MRSSTVIALAIVASAAPAFSVPVPQGDYTYELTARDVLSERDLIELFARAEAELPEGDESGALNWLKLGGTIFKGAKALFGGGGSNNNNNNNNNRQQKRPREYYDFETRDDLEARDDYLELRDDLEARDDLEFELFAREEPQDQSGAFKLPGIIGTLVSTLLGREDLEELLARDDIQEILAREEPHDQSGAIKLPGFLGKLASTLFGREELEEMFAREEYFARSMNELD